MLSRSNDLSASDPPPTKQSWNWNRTLPVIIVSLVTFIGAAAIMGFVANNSSQRSVDRYSAQTRDLRALESALNDAQSAVVGYLLEPAAESIKSYLAAERKLAAIDPAVLLLLEGPEFAATKPDYRKALTTLLDEWGRAVRLADSRGTADGVQALKHGPASSLATLLRTTVDRAVVSRRAAGAQLQRQLSSAHMTLLGTVMALTLVAMTAMVVAFRNGEREARGRERAIVESRTAHDRIEHLFFMADMLQSAASHEDTNAVLRATASHLLPGFSGAMYVFNNSRDRLDLATRWGGDLTAECADHFHPDACWALKRGKTNFNAEGRDGLRCGHVANGQVTLEIPMAARGQLHGLLEIVASGPEASLSLHKIRPIATAIGDAMSLSLSGMALRDRLRNLALKDPLTGLYNRRFLEETLERLGLDAERRRSPLSAIMIDLDHFKRLNDLHGHAIGDTALREVAGAVLANLRVTDVACRYGGEELAVLLPDCPLAMAEQKAEGIRAAIAELSIEGASLTASLGVSCLPESSARGELLANADAALYQAKQAGRDRVVAAPVRFPTSRFSVVEGGSIADVAAG